MRLVLWRLPGLTHFFKNEGEEGFDSSTIPNLFEQWCAFFNVPQEPDKCKCCETGPTVFPPYPRRLESLTVCRYHYTKTALSSQLFKDPECWSSLSRSADRHSPNWANQAAVKWYLCFPCFYFTYFIFSQSFSRTSSSSSLSSLCTNSSSDQTVISTANLFSERFKIPSSETLLPGTWSKPWGNPNSSRMGKLMFLCASRQALTLSSFVPL